MWECWDEEPVNASGTSVRPKCSYWHRYDDHVWDCFGNINASRLGFIHPSPKKRLQPGCPGPGAQLRILASQDKRELLLPHDAYLSTWIQFFSWTVSEPSLVSGCLPLFPLRKLSSSCQPLNDSSRPGVLPSHGPHTGWLDGGFHFLSR